MFLKQNAESTIPVTRSQQKQENKIIEKVALPAVWPVLIKAPYLMEALTGQFETTTCTNQWTGKKEFHWFSNALQTHCRTTTKSAT